MATLSHFEEAFRSVEWFIPPYAQMGFLSRLAGKILGSATPLPIETLEKELAPLYSAQALAAMVTSRYPIAPIVSDYKDTIAEAVEAHFLGLHHVASGGLIPVIEGAARSLLADRISASTEKQAVRDIFVELAVYCKVQSAMGRAGEPGEVTSMMDSFSWFTTNVLFANSTTQTFLDNTNRHGIAHGAYRDIDYGKPINFYKIVGAVDFLTFVSSFTANISWFAPDATPKSQTLTTHYHALASLARARPGAA